METEYQTPNLSTENRLNYKGTGGGLFEITLVNFFLCLFTFGIYYPWARARRLKYIYGETSFYGSRLSFHGTGQEMFVGFIKALFLIGGFYAAFIYFSISMQQSSIETDMAGFFFNLGMIYVVMLIFVATVLPLAIHGALKYRLAKTSWRGIRFGYRGDRGTMYGIFLKGLFLSIITLGIYKSWFAVNLRKYIISNIKIGDAQLEYNANGFDFFLLNLKGVILTILTLGIYSFWYMRDLYNFYMNNMSINHFGTNYRIKSTMTPGLMFELIVINWILIVFTLGIGTSWAITRQLRYMMANAHIEGDFNPDLIVQSEEEYNNALAEDLSDMLDLGFI